MAQSSNTNADVMVTGQGTVYGSPDIAILGLGVTANDASLETALNDANQRVSAIRDALLDNGLDAQDIRTEAFNIYPDERYDRDGNPRDTTFRVENILSIRVRELDKVGQLLTASINAGANRVQRVEYQMSDPSSMQQEARRLAVENARSKAEELANLAGVSLGSVTEIRELDNSYGGPPVAMASSAMIMRESAAMDVPVSGGQLSVTVKVSMGFDLQ